MSRGRVARIKEKLRSIANGVEGEPLELGAPDELGQVIAEVNVLARELAQTRADYAMAQRQAKVAVWDYNVSTQSGTSSFTFF